MIMVQGYVVEEATGVSVGGDVEVHSVMVTSLPTMHPSYYNELILEEGEMWKAPKLPMGQIELFVGIMSSTNHFAERMAVRKTWLQSPLIRSSRVVARFFVALVFAPILPLSFVSQFAPCKLICSKCLEVYIRLHRDCFNPKSLPVDGIWVVCGMARRRSNLWVWKEVNFYWDMAILHFFILTSSVHIRFASIVSIQSLCLLMEYGLNAACKQGDQLASEKGSRLL